MTDLCDLSLDSAELQTKETELQGQSRKTKTKETELQGQGRKTKTKKKPKEKKPKDSNRTTKTVMSHNVIAVLL